MVYKVGQLIEIPMGPKRENIVGVLVKKPCEQVYGPKHTNPQDTSSPLTPANLVWKIFVDGRVRGIATNTDPKKHEVKVIG